MGGCRVLKYEKEKERKAFKAMTFREKLTHIRNYYTLHIVAVIIVIAIGAWALNYYVINPPKTASLSIITMSDAGLNLDTTEFYQSINQELADLCTDSQEIQIQAMSMRDDEYQTGYYNSQKLVALVAAKSVDIIIGPLDLLKSYASADYFYHLDEFFSEEEAARMDTVSCEVTEETDEVGRVTKASGPYPLLISIGTPEILQSQFGTQQELYIGIVGNAPNPESVKIFIEYLLNMQ